MKTLLFCLALATTTWAQLIPVNALPDVVLVLPASAQAGETITLNIGGANFEGASSVEFVHSSGEHAVDPSIKTKKIAVSASGTQLTATISIDASAAPGPRMVRVVTPKGQSALDSPDTGSLIVTGPKLGNTP